MGAGDEAAQRALTAAGITVHSFSEFLESGRGAELTAVPPKPEDVCCIMYTRWAGEVLHCGRCICIWGVAFWDAATGGGAARRAARLPFICGLPCPVPAPSAAAPLALPRE